jgi:hypothetical protein
MAYAAIIGTLVNVGFDVYKQFGGTSAASRAGQYAKQLRGSADRFITPFTKPEYWNLNIPDMATQSLEYGYQQAPALNQFNMSQLQGLLGQALPGYQQMIGTAAGNTQALLSGQIPSDVQSQIQRTTAESAIAGGFAGSGAARSLTARDLGLTSLQLQQTGQSQMSSLIGTARNYLMPQPVNPTSLLPLSDLIGGAAWSKSATFQANQADYTAFANALAAQYGAPQTAAGGGLGGDISSLINALGQKNPQTGQSAGGGIMSMLGGLLNMGGSGGGGITGSSYGASAGTSGIDLGGGTLGLGFG